MNESDETLFDPRIADWLEEDPNAAPGQVLNVVLAAFPSIKQRRTLAVPWRFPDMSSPSKLVAIAAVAVVVVAVVGAYLLAPRPDSSLGGPPTSAPPSPSSMAMPTSGSPMPSPTLASTPTSGLDTTFWVAYESSQYDIRIGHPADWHVEPADRTWDFEKDGTDWLSPATDSFIAPEGDVRVSVWNIPLAPGTIVTWETSEVEAWYEDVYCPKTGGTSCAGVHERGVALCLELRDCHPGMMLPSYVSDTQAFFSLTNEAGMVVISIWRTENDPSVTRYGGATRLLEAFLSTMCVWPKDERPPFGTPCWDTTH